MFAAIKSYLMGLFVKDVAPVVISTVKTTIKAVVVAMSNTDLTGSEKKSTALAAVKSALTEGGLEIAESVLDEEIETAVTEL